MAEDKEGVYRRILAVIRNSRHHPNAFGDVAVERNVSQAQVEAEALVQHTFELLSSEPREYADRKAAVEAVRQVLEEHEIREEYRKPSTEPPGEDEATRLANRVAGTFWACREGLMQTKFDVLEKSSGASE